MIRIALSVLLSVSMVGPAFAQGSTTSAAAPPAAGGGGGTLPASLSPGAAAGSQPAATNLNLGSTVQSISGIAATQRGTVINVGGLPVAVSPTTQLTPAQYLAALQVGSGLPQALQLGRNGAALGGSAVLGEGFLKNLTSLVVPKNVQLTGLTTSGNINIAGDLVDHGSMFVTAANSALNAVNLNAANIVVTGLLAAPQNVAFNLNATGSVNNSGTIFGGGDVNIASGAGRITNSGLISSGNGSISLSSLTGADRLNVDARGGTFQAVNGSIDVNANNINLIGGNYLSHALNLNAATNGTIDVAIGQVTGALNTSGLAAHISANTANLTLGEQCLTGDPTYVNSGDITISMAIDSNGEDLAIIAGGDIVGVSGGSIRTGGGDLLLIAGAAFTTSSSGQYPSVANASVSVDLSSGNGGNVDFSNGAGGAVVSTTNNSGRGGDVTIVAHANGGTGGQVLFKTSSTITAAGTEGGGDVQVFAGGGSGSEVRLGAINAIGALGASGGTIAIAGTQAVTSDNQPLQVSTTGSVLPRNHIVPGALTAVDIVTGNLNAGSSGFSASQTGGRGGEIAIITNGSITTGDLASSGTTSGGAGGSGGAITVVAENDISIQSAVMLGAPSQGSTVQGGSGGLLVVTSTNGFVDLRGALAQGSMGSSATVLPVQGGTGGNGGTVSVYGKTGINTGLIGVDAGQGGSSVTAPSGDGGAGGTILLNSNGAITISGNLSSNGGDAGSAFSPGAGGHGGSISVHASTGISQDPNSKLTAAGGNQPNGGNFRFGDGGEVILTSTAGPISTGNIDVSSTGTRPGFPFSMGSGGQVIILGTEDVTVGSLSSSGIAPIDASGAPAGGNGGRVSISANTLTLNGVDGDNNVLLTNGFLSGGSVMLSLGGTANVLNFSATNPNFKTDGSGTFPDGNVWALSQTGTAHSTYTVNGDSNNMNDFTDLTVSALSGNSNLVFNSGASPTGFSPGGWTDVSAGILAVDTAGDTSLIVPIAATTGGSVRIDQLITGLGLASARVAAFSPNSISFPFLDEQSPDPFHIEAAVANEGNIDITGDMDIGTAIAGGMLILSGDSTSVTARNELKGQSIDIYGPGIDFAGTTATRMRTTGGSITFTGYIGNPLNVNNSALFTTGSTGNVSFEPAPGQQVTFTGTNNFVTTASNFAINASQVLLNNASIRSTAGGDITFNGGSNLIVQQQGTFATLPAGTTSFEASSIISLENVGITTNGTGRVVFDAPRVEFHSAVVNANGRSTIEIKSDQLVVEDGLPANVSTNNGAILVRPITDLSISSLSGGAATLSLDAGGGTSTSLVDIQAGGNVTLAVNTTLASNAPIQVNLNAAKTVLLDANSVLKTTYSGNAAFPDPLGGTFPYSILFQNLITDFTISGTGTVLQGGTTPGYTVFNDYVQVGIADGADLKFVSTNPGSLVNFFTRQVQLIGSSFVFSGTLRGTNVDAFNFNTNLPSFSPGGGDFAFTVSNNPVLSNFSVLGAPLAVGFVGTPPAGIPANQQPLTIFNVGLLSKQIALTADENIVVSSTHIGFNGSSFFNSSKSVVLQSSTDLTLTGDVATSALAGTTILAPSVVLPGFSQILATGTLVMAPGAAATDMSVTVDSIGLIAATEGLRFAPTAALEFKTSGSIAQVRLQSGSNDIVEIDGAGDVTISDKLTLISSSSSVQIDLAADTKLNFGSQSLFRILGGVGSADTPNLLVSSAGAFTLAGDGHIQVENAPAFISFRSPVGIGFDSGTTLDISAPNGGTVVNFLSPQFVINGDGMNAAATAQLSASGVNAFNFNTTNAAGVPGPVDFEPGALATSATLGITGAPVNIGYTGPTPADLPSGQPPVNVLTVGLLGQFALNAPSINANANGIQIWNGSSLSASSGDLTLATLAASNQPIFLNGTLGASGAVTVAVHGTGNVLSLGGSIVADTVTLSAGTGNIGGSLARVEIFPGTPQLATNVSVNTTGGSAFLTTYGDADLESSKLGNGTFVLTVNGSLGVNGAVQGNQLFLFSTSSDDSITVQNGGAINGTSVSLTGRTVTNNGTISGTTDLSIGNDFTDTLDVQGSGTWSAPGVFGLISQGGINAGASLSPVLQGGANDLQIRAGGVVTLPVNVLSVAPNSVTGQGGNITVRTVSLAVPDTSAPITFNADADPAVVGTLMGLGQGGRIQVDMTGATAQIVGSGAGNLQFSAKASPQTDGAGGTVLVSNRGNLTVNPTAVVATPGENGAGSTFVFSAGADVGTGVLVVKGALSANGNGSGSGGTVELRSSSTTAFVVNSKTTKNGVQGLVSVNGGTPGHPGSMQFVNNAGAVSLMQSVTVSSLSLNAAGAVSSGAANVINASSIIASSVNAGVTLPNINAVNSTSVSVEAASSSKGTIALTNKGVGTLEVFNVNGGGAMTVNAAAGSVSLGNVGQMQAPSALTVTALRNIDNGSAINVNGAITEKTTATTGSSRISVTSNMNATGAITFTNAGAPVANSGIDTSSGNVISSKSVTYTASKGDILIGQTTAPKVTATAFNKLETSELVTGITGVTLKTTSTKGPDSGSITLGSIRTGTPNVGGSVGGAIAVTAAGGTLRVRDEAALTAFSDKTTKATILLQNNEVTGTTTGNILVGADARIETVGAFASSVTLTMGAAVQKNTTLPDQNGTGLTFNPSTQPTPPVFFFGTNGVNFNSTPASPIEVNSSGGQKVIFNTGKLTAGAIQIDGGGLLVTTITAKAIGEVEQIVDDFVVDTDEDDADEALTLLPR